MSTQTQNKIIDGLKREAAKLPVIMRAVSEQKIRRAKKHGTKTHSND